MTTEAPVAVTPDVTATPEAPAPAVVEQPAGPMSKREALASLRSDMAAARTAKTETAEVAPEAPPVVDQQGRKRDPVTGQFLPETEAQQDTEASPAEARAADEPAEAPKAAERPTTVRIQLPADHPLRDQGVEHIDVLPEQEQVGRAAVNAYARKREVEAVIRERDELRQRLLQRESVDAATAKWQATPGYAEAVERYHEIAETVGQQAASIYWKGVQDEFRALQQQEYGARLSVIEAAEIDRAGEQWTHEARQRAERIDPEVRNLPEYPRVFAQAVESFNDELERGHYPHCKTPEDLHKQFEQVLGTRLLREPAVVQIYRSRQQRAPDPAAVAAQEAAAKRAADLAAAQAVAEFKRNAAQTRQATPPHPLGSVAAAAVGGRSVAAGADEPDLSKMTPSQLRSHLAAASRQTGRELISGSRQ